MIAVKRDLGRSLGPGEWGVGFIYYLHSHFMEVVSLGKMGEGSPSVTPQSSQHSACRVAWKEIEP